MTKKNIKAADLPEVEVPSEDVIQKYHKFVNEVQSMNVQQIHAVLDELPDHIRELMYLYFNLEKTTPAAWEKLRQTLIKVCKVPDSEKDKQGDPWLVNIVSYHLIGLRNRALEITTPVTAGGEFNPFN